MHIQLLKLVNANEQANTYARMIHSHTVQTSKEASAQTYAYKWTPNTTINDRRNIFEYLSLSTFIECFYQSFSLYQPLSVYQQLSVFITISVIHPLTVLMSFYQSFIVFISRIQSLSI